MIDGIVYDKDSSTPVSGATVTLYHRTSGKKTTDTSDSNGAYALDLANAVGQTGSYSNGDNLCVEALSGYKIKQYDTTVDTSQGAETANLTLAYTSGLHLVLDLLNSNWRKENTDNILPQIGRIYDYKEIDLDNNDYVLCYEASDELGPFGIGGSRFQSFPLVSIDFRTANRRNSTIPNVYIHTNKMKEEIHRIIKANITPLGGYQLLLPQRKRDLSDRSTGIGRMVLDCTAKKWGA